MRRLFLAVARGLFRLFEASLNDFHIRKNQFKLDGLEVALGIDLPVYVNDVAVVEAADHMSDRVHLAYMRKKFISESFSLARALDETGDIDKFDRGRHDPAALIHFFKHAEARIRNRNDADIRVNGAERIIGSFCSRFGKRVKNRAFPYIGKSDDTYFHVSPL